MTKDEIKELILRRAYAGAFEDEIGSTFNLHKYAEEKGIDNEAAWKAFDELKSEGFMDDAEMGGFVKPMPRGLIYCEEHKFADEKLIKYQQKIRTKLLVTLADIHERSTDIDFTDWEKWIKEAGVSQQEWQNNEDVLIDFGLIKRISNREYSITSHGLERVADYRKRKKRQDDFEKLEKLEGVTQQQRGHKLEDLLAESAEWEGWDVSPRVRAQGQENDIIMHIGLHYFLSSCKWEAEPIQSQVAELVETRVRRRPPANGGIVFSMSGFTPNCIEEMRLMIASALIIPFGPVDIRRIMQDEVRMTDLLADKIDQVMKHRNYLVDGEIR